MSNPPLTVVMPAHNAEKTVAAAIQSILCQSYPLFELWVLENNSTDRTAEIARSFTDPRVKVFELGPVGFQGALGYALENAKTEWLARMDADDLSFPDRFKEQVEAIRQHPEAVMVGTQRAYLTPFGHIFEPTEKIFSKEITRFTMRMKERDHKFFVDPSVIFRRRVALEVGGYDPEFQMGDVPMWFRMLKQGTGWEIARPLYLYRLLPQSMTLTQIKTSNQNYRLLVKYVPELLHLYPEETALPRNDAPHRQKFWLRILDMELLTGDRRAILQAASFLERDERFGRKVRWMKWFAYLGRIGGAYYSRRKPREYRHRPDWEALFTSLVGSFMPDQEGYF